MEEICSTEKLMYITSCCGVKAKGF